MFSFICEVKSRKAAEETIDTLKHQAITLLDKHYGHKERCRNEETHYHATFYEPHYFSVFPDKHNERNIYFGTCLIDGMTPVYTYLFDVVD